LCGPYERPHSAHRSDQGGYEGSGGRVVDIDSSIVKPNASGAKQAGIRAFMVILAFRHRAGRSTTATSAKSAKTATGVERRLCICHVYPDGEASDPKCEPPARRYLGRG